MNPDNITPLSAEELVKLGLRFDPFAGQSAFFARPALVQRIDLLHHLVQYTELLLVVVGERGAGKSTLLDELIARAGDNWQVSRVACDSQLTDKALVDRIITGFGQTVGAPGSLAALRLLERHLEALRGKGKVALVAIDDAQALTPEVLRPFLQWATQREAARPRLIVQCESAFLPKLLSTLRALGKADLAHSVEVPPLTEAQTDEYLQMRLERAGWSGASPFRIGVVKSIYKASGGTPGKVNESGQKVLRNLVHGRSESVGFSVLSKLPFKLGHSNLRPLAYGALGLGLTVGLAFVWNATQQTEPAPDGLEQAVRERLTDPTRPSVDLARVDVIESEAGTGPASPSGVRRALVAGTPAHTVQGNWLEPAVTPPHGEHGQVSTTDSPASKAVTPPAQSAGESSNTAAMGELNVGEQDGPAPPGTAPIKTADSAAIMTAMRGEEAALAGTRKGTDKAVRSTPERMGESALESSVAGSSSASTPVENGVPASPSMAPPNDEAVRDIGWLRRQAPDHYTIQLIGTHSRRAMDAFVQTHRLGSQAAWFKTSHRDKDWYVVVYGIYADRKLALTELESLPEGLRRAQPWPRRVASVLAAEKAQR